MLSIAREDAVSYRYDLVTVLKGTLFSGLGVARTRVADNLDLYETKTRMRFFPGTLNLRLPAHPPYPLTHLVTYSPTPSLSP